MNERSGSGIREAAMRAHQDRLDKERQEAEAMQARRDVNDARIFSERLEKAIGVKITIKPGVREVVIDGLTFYAVHPPQGSSIRVKLPNRKSSRVVRSPADLGKLLAEGVLE